MLVGEVITQSEAALLEMLCMRPIAKQMRVRWFWQKGIVCHPDILDISDIDIAKAFQQTVHNYVTPLALETSHACLSSIPFLLRKAYVTVLAVSTDSSYNHANTKEQQLLAQQVHDQLYLSHHPPPTSPPPPFKDNDSLPYWLQGRHCEESEDDVGASLFE